MRPRTRPESVEHERGQATVEFAVVLPFVLVLMLGVAQVAVVGVDLLLVTNAARAAAREAAVNADRAAIEKAAYRSGLDRDRLAVVVERPPQVGAVARVTVRYRARTSIPLVGSFVPDLDVARSASMRVE